MTGKTPQTSFTEEKPLDNEYVGENRRLINSVFTEGIRQSRISANQAHLSFSVAIAVSAVSAIIGLAGAGLLILGKASEGSVTAAAGLASSVYSYQVSKDALERQRQANQRLDQMIFDIRNIETE